MFAMSDNIFYSVLVPPSVPHPSCAAGCMRTASMEPAVLSAAKLDGALGLPGTRPRVYSGAWGADTSHQDQQMLEILLAECTALQAGPPLSEAEKSELTSQVHRPCQQASHAPVSTAGSTSFDQLRCSGCKAIQHHGQAQTGRACETGAEQCTVQVEGQLMEAGATDPDVPVEVTGEEELPEGRIAGSMPPARHPRLRLRGPLEWQTPEGKAAHSLSATTRRGTESDSVVHSLPCLHLALTQPSKP